MPRFFPFDSKGLALTSPFQIFCLSFLSRFFFVSRATYSLFDKCTALPYDTCMARGRGRPSAEVIPRRSIDKLRQGYLSNCLPPLDLVANALGVSRSMIGKIIHNRAYYSSAYASQLDIVKERRAQFLLELTDG